MKHSLPLVVVVDDEESVRRALIRLLRASRLDAEAFATGEDFLNSLKLREPDCLILDLQMPGLSGRDVQRQMLTANMRFPVIIITAYDEPMIKEQCIADGAFAYLRKPLRGNVLVRTIEAAIFRSTTP